MSNHQINDQRPHRATGGEYGDNALSVAERSFRLLTTGPNPLALDGRTVGHGLPARAIDLSELRTLLLETSASDELKDAAWRELVRRSRSGDPAWVVGCVGVAMPGLKSTAARVIRYSPSRLVDDIVSELLTEFVAQLARIDIERPHIAARLMLWARKGALRARGRDARHVPCDPSELPDHPPVSDVDPVVLLLEAARQGIITSAAAELINATRLDGLSVQRLAKDKGEPASRLYKQRQVAEVRLVDAIRDGRISVMSAAHAMGM
ncbi:hypothetical protein [Actinomadura chokoriensis]|uniref:Sigma-70 family RNA polymerase sigma factor n=1 Tax=Actinomadura chokoriensis TaxID=454156 RepID=A0ABV4R7D2_9ACTN